MPAKPSNSKPFTNPDLTLRPRRRSTRRGRRTGSWWCFTGATSQSCYRAGPACRCLKMDLGKQLMMRPFEVITNLFDMHTNECWPSRSTAGSKQETASSCNQTVYLNAHTATVSLKLPSDGFGVITPVCALSPTTGRGSASALSGRPQSTVTVHMLAASQPMSEMLVPAVWPSLRFSAHRPRFRKWKADAGSWRQVGDLTRGEVAALRWPRGDGIALVEDVVSFLQPYSDRIILDAKTRDVVREDPRPQR